MPIPVSQIVEVNPSVVGVAGNPLSLNAIFLDQGLTTPADDLLAFYSAEEVGDWYGFSSDNYKAAVFYFNGFNISTKKPGTLFFGGYANAARAAWNRGQKVYYSLAVLKTIVSGTTLSITIDGVVKSAADLDLSTATSYSDVATLLTTELGLTGTAAVTWDSLQSCFVVTSGTTGVDSTITQATGTGSEYLGLSAGILSQGAAIDTPLTAMDRIKELNFDWATFTTTFECTLEENEMFAVWALSQNLNKAYVSHDDDAGYKSANNTGLFGNLVQSQKYDGTLVVFGDLDIAAATCGYAASIDFQSPSGRATLAMRQFDGLEPTVDRLSDAKAVLSNNASYYGAYVDDGDNNEYNIMYDGRMLGSKFTWFDTFLCQLYLNSQLRKSIFAGMAGINSIPYNSVGYAFVRSWCQDPIDEALKNGTIRTGVKLDNQQKSKLLQQAGIDISSELENKGYYIQILDASSQTRVARKSPPFKLWYTDGGSIQQITLNSIAVL